MNRRDALRLLATGAALLAPALLFADTGANPWKYGNPQMLLNFDGLKQLLYGPIPGPPRNPAQVGQQG